MPQGVDVRLELDSHALNGESPRWCASEANLYWVDTRSCLLHAFDPRDRKTRTWRMPGWIGCHVLSETASLLALRTGLFEFDLVRLSLRQVAMVPYDSRRFIFNDGGCDPYGRFLVGEMYLPLTPGEPQDDHAERAPLYRLTGGAWVDMAAPTKTSNGLAWSPDGRTMYQSDTAAQVIYTFGYDVAHGQASHRRIFAHVEVSDATHGPDGAAVDSEGFYWSAIFGEGCLLRFDPTGALERRVDLPIKYPTMPAFGGPDLRTLYITSANWPLQDDARATRRLEGGLFSMEAPVPGLPLPLYDRTR